MKLLVISKFRIDSFLVVTQHHLICKMFKHHIHDICMSLKVCYIHRRAVRNSIMFWWTKYLVAEIFHFNKLVKSNKMFKNDILNLMLICVCHFHTYYHHPNFLSIYRDTQLRPWIWYKWSSLTSYRYFEPKLKHCNLKGAEFLLHFPNKLLFLTEFCKIRNRQNVF